MADSRHTFVVLGGTGSIGAALVRQFSRAGDNVVVGARNPRKAARLADEVDCDVHKVEAEAPHRSDPVSKQP